MISQIAIAETAFASYTIYVMRMNKILIIAVVLVVFAGGAACYFYRDKFSEPPKQTAIKPKHNKPFNPDIVMTVGDKKFDVKLADNETTRALFTQLPFTVKMEDHLANEKFAASPEDLPANHTKPKRVETGDIMLYGVRAIVLFYKSIDTPYKYVRIGKVTNPEQLEEVLGANVKKVDVTFSMR